MEKKPSEAVVTPKKKGFPWGYIFMGIIIICLMGAVGFLYQGGESDKAKISRLERNVQIAEQEIQYFKNDLGEKIAEIEAKQYANSRELKEFEGKTLERIKEIGGNVKKVSNYVKFSTEVIDSIRKAHKQPIVIVNPQTGEPIDSLPLSLEDKWMKINGVVTAEDYSLDYKYTPSYEIVSTWKKPEGEGFGARKRLMVDIVPENPKENVTEASSFEVMQPKLKFFETKAFWSTLSAALTFLVMLVTK